MKLSKKDTDIIMKSKLFRGTAESVLTKMALGTDCVIKSYSKGELIYSRNMFSHSLGIILEGTVRVFKDNGDAHRIILNTLSVGSIFGAAALFNDEKTYVTEICAIEACRVIFFSQRLISRGIERDYRLAENYIRFLSDRILFLNRKIFLLSAGSAEQRLASFLLDNLPENSFAELPLTMVQLSGELDISRASLYRVMDELIESGAIEKDGRRIMIRDRQKLRKLQICRNL